MQAKVLKGRIEAQVPQVLQHLLFKVQMRSFWHLRQQAPVPLLQRHEEQQGQAQVPLMN